MRRSPSISLALSSRDGSLGAIAEQLPVVMGAGDAIARDLNATAFDGDGNPRRAWIGALPAARDLIDAILREQESHYCCAEAPTWIVQWTDAGAEQPPAPDGRRAPAVHDVTPGMVAERLHESCGAHLTFLVELSFGQGCYVADCSWWGSDATLEAVRRFLRERLTPDARSA